MPCKLRMQHKVSEATTAITAREPLSEDLKFTYTQLVCKDYSTDILRHLCTSSVPMPTVLGTHGITANLRSKMVDWMIEVLSSYKMSEETFFRSVYMMDAYLKKTTARL